MTGGNSEVSSLLSSESEEQRLKALRALDLLQGDSPQWLLSALGDESWRLRKEATEIFLSLPNASCLVGEVVELLHSEDNAGLRNAAVEILVRLGSPALPCLIEELSCNDHDVRKFALDILGAIGDPFCIAAMQKSLHDSDANVRAAAAENLGRLRAAEAIPALLGAMGQPDLMLRFAILDALARIGAPIPLAPLLPFYEDKLLRKALIESFGQLGDEEAIPLLLKALGDELRKVREASAVALLRIEQRYPGTVVSQLQALAGLQPLDNIALLLESSDRMVRRAAFQLLQWLQALQLVPKLLPFLAVEEDREDVLAVLVSMARHHPEPLMTHWPQADTITRTCLAYIFGEARCAGALPLLVAALAADDGELPAVAAQALGRLGAPAAIPPLALCLSTTDDDLRQASRLALVYLARSLATEVVQHVRPVLEKGMAAARVAAVQVIGSLPGGEGAASLALAIKDESAPVRAAAIRAIGPWLTSDELTPVVLSLTDEDADVRRIAAEVLGGCGDGQAVAPLSLTLLDEDLWVRAASVRALGRLPGGLRGVSAALTDPVGLVCIAALETLCEANDDAAFAALLAAIDHPDEEVVKTALRLLANRPRQDWLPQGGRLLDHPHREVRMTIARLLVEAGADRSAALLENRLAIEGDELVRGHLVELLALFREED
jgi:HEAT repeat protein